MLTLHIGTRKLQGGAIKGPEVDFVVQVKFGREVGIELLHTLSFFSPWTCSLPFSIPLTSKLKLLQRVAFKRGPSKPTSCLSLILTQQYAEAE